nr:hypothetical protein [Lachnospiraceae bacterium]
MKAKQFTRKLMALFMSIVLLMGMVPEAGIRVFAAEDEAAEAVIEGDGNEAAEEVVVTADEDTTTSDTEVAENEEYAGAEEDTVEEERGAAVEYRLWVCGTQVTGDNKNDILGDGSVSYKGSDTQGTLYITGSLFAEKNEKNAVIYSELFMGLTVCGNDSRYYWISSKGEDKNSYSVYCKNGSLTLEGDISLGSFTDAGIRTDDEFGNVTIQNGTLTIHNGNGKYGILVNDATSRLQVENSAELEYENEGSGSAVAAVDVTNQITIKGKAGIITRKETAFKSDTMSIRAGAYVKAESSATELERGSVAVYSAP